MRGVEVYKRIKAGPYVGQKIGKGLSRVVEVQAEMTRVSEAMGHTATAIHAAHPRTAATMARPDHSRITIERGRVDRFIILDDTTSEFAPRAIEYGSKNNPGIHTLQKTVNKFRKG